MEENTIRKKSNKSLHIIYLSIIVLLLGTIGFLSWKLHNQKVVYLKQIIKIKETTNDERERLTKDLNNMLDQYQSMKTNNKRINRELKEQQEKIEKMIAEVKNLKANNYYQIKQYKDEIETLRKIMRHYVVQIDSLNTLNQGLKAENVKVKADIQKEKTTVEELSQKNEQLATKVNIAAVLKAQSIEPFALNKRSKPITKAKKVEKFKICFIIIENDIAPPGVRDVYLRIARPDGLVLATSEQDLFKFGNEMIVFSAKRQVDFQNKNVDMCIYWDNNQELIPGSYTVDLFADGNIIGTAKFDLK
ncbi:MAG: hypothetical protein HY958_14030 [Bacteroidia bacterium]|nr:hypothetical protein [Bacteroidia bacterium]